MHVNTPIDDANMAMNQESQWTRLRRQTSFFYAQGRLNRTHYVLSAFAWWAMLFFVGIMLMISLGLGVLYDFANEDFYSLESLSVFRWCILGAGALIITALGGIVIVVSYCLTIRRLHDMNFSGWWLVVFFALSVMHVYFKIFFPNLPTLCVVSAILSLLFSFVLYLIPGSKNKNRFGEPEEKPQSVAVLIAVVLVFFGIVFSLFGVTLEYLELTKKIT